MQETLLHLRPKTPQEELLWERAKTKELEEKLAESERKNGELQSELDEFKHRMKKEQVGALILRNNTLKKSNHDKNEKLKQSKKLITELQVNLVRLQTTGSINKQLDDNTNKESTSSSPANL